MAMDNQRQNGQVRIDWDCMIRDVLMNWWMIILAAVGTAFLVAALVLLRYTPLYTSETIFVIGRSGFNYNAVSANLQQAETTTKQYTQVVNSSILRKQVSEDLGMGFNASVDVQTVPSSNLMVLRVTSTSPRNAYLINKSVVTNAVDLMSYFMDNVTMQELQPALVPEKPSNPLHMRGYIEKAIPAGALLMIIILALLSHFKDTIKSPEDVNLKIDAKLIGSIRYEKKRRSAAAKAAGKQGSLLLNNPMLSFAYVEGYRIMGTRLRLMMEKANQKVLMICSVSENEGKSTVAANVAVSLAQEGKRVLLMDCDFRKPAQYKIFEIEDLGDKDFGETIRNHKNAKVGHVKNLPGLYTLFSIEGYDKTWAKDELEHLSNVLAYMRKKVDYIVIDTAPMAMVSDTEEYAALADAALLVVRQDVMETRYINDAIDDLEQTGIQLLGCALNGVRRGMITRTKEYGRYGGNYSKYSHYSNVREQGGN